MWFYLAIFFIEFLWSVISNRANLSVVKRQPWKAGTYGFASAVMAWAIPAWIYLYSRDPSYMVPAILGDCLGDAFAAWRKPKRKKRAAKIGVSTA